MLPETEVSRLDFFEYQAMMLVLAGVMCVSMTTVELVINRFHVLPILFPSLFMIRQRRFYAYGVDVTDGKAGRQLREGGKMIVRMTLCVTLSYLWGSCFLDTFQSMGSEFPRKQCSEDYDCFASPVQVMTLVRQEHSRIDCSEVRDFETDVVVSCMRIIPMSANKMLMHLGVSYAISQLTFKVYEVMVWIASRSRAVRRLLGVSVFFTFVSLMATYVAGLLDLFISSWMTFVMTLVMPLFLYTVRSSGRVLNTVRLEEEESTRESIKGNLDKAFADIEADFGEAMSSRVVSRGGPKISETARALQSIRTFLASVPARVAKRRRETDGDDDGHSNTAVCAASEPSDTEGRVNWLNIDGEHSDAEGRGILLGTEGDEHESALGFS